MFLPFKLQREQNKNSSCPLCHIYVVDYREIQMISEIIFIEIF